MPYLEKGPGQGCYFRIQYNFESGTLLLVAISTMSFGTAVLKISQSLLIMADTVIDCGGRAFRFLIEFPDLCQCAAAHEHNYREYTEKLGLPNALYMATSRVQDPPIGHLYRSKALLGQGAFGEVHKAVHIHTGELSAIKILHDEEYQDTQHEARILSELIHPNIVEYRNAFRFNGKICMIMELAATDLDKYIDIRKRSRKSYLSLRCIRHIIRHLLLGIEYIHNEGFTHRDLKPTNILVTDLPTVKLADFGLASIELDPSSLCGTPTYIAPEIEAEMALRDKI
ncbi:NUAK SNF1-like kinase 1 [Lambiella insularis]|nr:NUAK SNF1-like kinase 1 [Lambiella insularis]